MRLFDSGCVFLAMMFVALEGGVPVSREGSPHPVAIAGFPNPEPENATESKFLAVPDPKLAEQHLKALTRLPHIAGSEEDKATADYVAGRLREAGLETETVEYRVWMNYPGEISVDVTAPTGVTMHGPTREFVNGDPYENDPRVVTP